jgi:hypothetical protein
MEKKCAEEILALHEAYQVYCKFNWKLKISLRKSGLYSSGIDFKKHFNDKKKEERLFGLFGHKLTVKQNKILFRFNKKTIKNFDFNKKYGLYNDHILNTIKPNKLQISLRSLL